MQKVELGCAYPLKAFALILVPIGSHLVFGERFKPQYFVGVEIVMTGIVVTLKE